MPALPALFVSHGAPDIVLSQHAARNFLARLPRSLAFRPKAILVVSAHWETSQPMIGGASEPGTIHDFGNFDQRLFAMRYPAKGAPALAAEIARRLASEGIDCAIDAERGLDHGAWIPLSLAWPDADIPVLQLSVQPDAGPERHYRLGRALAWLRSQQVLIMGSGSFTHDLASYSRARHLPDAAEPDWVGAFASWMLDRLDAGDVPALLDYRQRAPHAERNHPTEEHLLPLFVALGAAGENVVARALHSSVSHGVLRMDTFSFGAEQ